jgi:ribA/ribD-fused uncharacterized protein
MKAIDSFSGPYRFLSNFYPSPVKLGGVVYSTIEHAFQAAKTLDNTARLAIRDAATPGIAKRMGRTVALRLDWEKIKVEVMEGLVRQKFRRNPFRRWLLNTGEAELIEGNHWGDRFWGVCLGTGRNELGKVLMRVRSELYTAEEEAWLTLNT